MVIKSVIVCSIFLCTGFAQAQWDQNPDGSQDIILHPSNSEVDVLEEGVGYTRYGVWMPGGEYHEFEVNDPTWLSFDINTTGATDTDDTAWGWPDGRTDIADLRLFFCLFNSQDELADVNTTGEQFGDDNWGIPDGLVDNDDLSYVVHWFAQRHGSSNVSQMLADALGNGDPCKNKGVGEFGLAPNDPTPMIIGEELDPEFVPMTLFTWNITLAYDLLLPHMTLALVVDHIADQDGLCPASETPITHFSNGRQEIDFVMQAGAVPVSTTKVFEKQSWTVIDAQDNSCGYDIGESKLETAYRATYKVGVYLPIRVPWAGIGQTFTKLHYQKSETGCSCP